MSNWTSPRRIFNWIFMFCSFNHSVPLKDPYDPCPLTMGQVFICRHWKCIKCWFIGRPLGFLGHIIFPYRFMLDSFMSRSGKIKGYFQHFKLSNWILFILKSSNHYLERGKVSLISWSTRTCIHLWIHWTWLVGQI